MTYEQIADAILRFDDDVRLMLFRKLEQSLPGVSTGPQVSVVQKDTSVLEERLGKVSKVLLSEVAESAGVDITGARTKAEIISRLTEG